MTLPLEPTDAMIEAGRNLQGNAVYSRPEIMNIYRDMVEAYLKDQPSNKSGVEE